MPRTVLAAVDDMLFVSKIRATADHLGIELRSVRSAELLISLAREGAADLIIVDLHSQKLDPLALVKALKSEERLASIRLLGFFSHVQTELGKAAVAAGYDVVIPRSVFARDLAEILEGKKGETLSAN